MARRTTTDWDARTYDRLAAPQEGWATKVLERLPLTGTETVLDAGSGSGRATKLLLDRLPTGLVIGVDGSPSMTETARDKLAPYGDRVRLLCADLLELSPELVGEETGAGPVDAVFSNATFHWIDDHERLFERLFSVLRPGGRLVAQCGGTGNVEAWVRAVKATSEREAFSVHLSGFHPWNFVSPERTEERLAAAGFEEIRCWLEEIEPYTPDDPRNFIAVVGLAAHHERLPAELHDSFTEAVLDELPDSPELRYIRLNLDATRPE